MDMVDLSHESAQKSEVGVRISFPRILGYTVYISTNQISQQSCVIDLIIYASRTIAEPFVAFALHYGPTAFK